MKNPHCIKFGITLAGVLTLIEVSAKAYTFGGGANTFPWLEDGILPE